MKEKFTLTKSRTGNYKRTIGGYGNPNKSLWMPEGVTEIKDKNNTNTAHRWGQNFWKESRKSLLGKMEFKDT